MKSIYCLAMGLLLSTSGCALYSAAGPMDIHDAAEKGDLSEVKRILEQNPALVNTTREGWWLAHETPLYIAARSGHIGVVKRLTEHGADVNARNGLGWTPLRGAVANYHSEVVRYLVEHGADGNVNDRDNDGDALLVYTSQDIQIRQYLLAQNFLEAAKIASSHISEPRTNSFAAAWAMVKGIIWGARPTIKQLVTQGVCINTRDAEGNNVLHYAAAQGNYCLALYLLGHSTASCALQGICAENNAHESFLDWAIKNDQWVFVKAMLQAACVPVKDDKGEPLSVQSINTLRKECITTLEQIFPTKKQKC